MRLIGRCVGRPVVPFGMAKGGIFLSDLRGCFQGDKTSKKPVYHSKPRIFMSAGVLDDVYLLENQAKSGNDE